MKVIMQTAGKAALRNGGGSAEALFPAGGRQSAVSECEPATVPFGPLYSSSRRQQIFYPQNSVVKGGRKHQAVSEPLVIKCFFLETRSVLAEL